MDFYCLSHRTVWLCPASSASRGHIEVEVPFWQRLCGTHSHSHGLLIHLFHHEGHFQVLTWVGASLKKCPGRGHISFGQGKKGLTKCGNEPIGSLQQDNRCPGSKDRSTGSQDYTAFTEQTKNSSTAPHLNHGGQTPFLIRQVFREAALQVFDLG